MLSTSMGVQFEVNDLDASYELVGTSDNYSFQYKLGRGSDLVNDVGEAANEIIPLKGNYGSFEVKVFAVSDIGIRSEFILGNIDITPPTFEGTFTFNNLRILEGFGGVDDTLNIEYAPESPGDELIVTQQFAGKSVQLAWELIPPVGHPREGQSVDTELLNDTFFSGIIVNIKNDGQLIDQQDLGNSEALAQSLLSNDVIGILNNYRDFSLNLNTAVFNDLDLQRNVSVELVAVDLLGGTCTGTLSGYNPPPEFSNFSYSLRGSDISFSWFINDLDYKNIDVNVLAVEKDVDLFDTGNYDSSVNYFQSINETVDSNKVWDSSKNVSYESGDLVLWKDNVYKALLNHQSSFNDHPIDGYPWENLGPKVSFQTKNESSKETVFSNTQLWGYEYYYTFQAFDDFGAGDVMLLGEDGILQAQGSEDAGMFPYESVVQIGNLRYIEDEDDFVFNWNVVDQDGNAVDLNQYKFAFKESSLPTMLGLSGSLYDIESNQFLTGITEGENGIGLNLDENGNTEIVGGLASTKVFDTFRFTRELNNQVYGVGGFPSNYSVFDDAVYYQQNDHVSVTGTLYKSITSQVDAGQKTIRPEYYDWENSENYQPGDCAVYNGNIYQLNASYGPAYTDGIFDFETLHVAGDLVVAPTNSFRKFYESSLFGEVGGAINSGQFTTNLTNVVDNTFQSLSITINGQTKTIASYDGYNKTITLDSNLNSLPQNGDAFEINGFEYQGGSVVVHNNKLFRSRSFQSGDTIATPGTDSSKWTQVSAFSQVPCEIYKCINANNFNPNESDIDWQIQDPESSDKFDGYISGYSERVSEWNSEEDFFISDLVVYANDLWSGVIDSGPNSETGIIAPGSDTSVWVNNVGGQDIVFDYNQGDLVYTLGAVYQAAANDPVGAPIEAISNPGSESLSTYQGTEWIPYWQYETIYDDLVFGHVGIPESGKRSVGIELGIVDSNNQVFSLTRLNAYNQQPSILPSGFRVDSLSETTKIKFTFNYAFQSQEKTTKVNLYRVPAGEVDIFDEDGRVVGQDFSKFQITGADGLPYETIGGDSTLVKVTLGAGDSTFEEDKIGIVDTPPIPKINGVDQETGYYYKILPFDHFGSGDLFGVDRNQGGLTRCWVKPKNFSTSDPNGLPGPVYRTSADDIPGPVVGFNGNVAFENFFLNWFHPNGQISTDDNGKILYNNFIPNDLSHYEVWISEYDKLQFGSLDGGGAPVYLKNKKDNTLPVDFDNDKGYRRILGDILSTGPAPIELQDPAAGITNATQAFTVSANGVEVETSYPGKTNDTRYFWVRAVDHAGNKSPFTGASELQGDTHEILGLGLTLGVASATDIEDFEINMTQSFGNTIALVPNNPFENNSNVEGKISWTQHYLFNEGTGFIVDASGDGTSDGYVWWDRNDHLKNLNLNDYYVRWQNPSNQQISDPIKWGELLNNRDKIIEWSVIDPNNNQDQLNLKNVYFSGVNYQTSSSNPASNLNEGDITSTEEGFHDGDFIVARNTNGIATPVYHAFANALIGTANIEEAAIKTAHVNDLSADKIIAGKIKGHEIEIFHGIDENSPLNQVPSSEFGSIKSAGFNGLVFDQDFPERLDGNTKGFSLSGDGSFAFQNGSGSLSFEQDRLILRGGMRQIDNKDYDFIDINLSKDYFQYSEDETGYVLDDAVGSNINLIFRNTSVTQYSDILFAAYVVDNGGQQTQLFAQEYVSVNDLNGIDDYYNFSFHSSDSEIGGGYASISVSLSADGFDRAMIFAEETRGGVDYFGESVIIKTKTSNSSLIKSETISRIIDGKVAELLRLTASSQTFNLKKDYTSDVDEIIIQADIQGNSQDIKWTLECETQIYVPGGPTPPAAPKIYTTSGNEVNQSNYTTTTSVKIKFNEFVRSSDKKIHFKWAKIRAETEPVDGVFRFDEITVFVLEEGSDAITVILSNENHTFHFLEKYKYTGGNYPTSGDPYVGSGTNIEVFEGTNRLTYSTATTIPEGSFSISETSSKQGSSNEISVGAISAENDVGAKVADHSSLLATSEQLYINYQITIRRSNNQLQTIDKRQTFSVSRDGPNLRTLIASADSYIFSQSKDGSGASSLTPVWIELTVEKKNLDGEEVTWTHNKGNEVLFYEDKEENTTADIDITGDTVYIKRDAFYDLNVDNVTITATTSTKNTNDQLSDSFSIFKVREGSNAITAILGNPNHSLTQNITDKAFDLDAAGSGTTIQVLDGDNALTAKTDATNLGNGQYYVKTVAVSDNTKITEGSLGTITTGDEIITYGDITVKDDTLTSAYIDFTIEGKKNNGKDFSLILRQTFSVSRIGSSVNYWFTKFTPSGSDNTPTYYTSGASPGTGWQDDISDLSEAITGTIWIIKGVSDINNPAQYQFRAPYQLEAEAVAELTVYQKTTSSTAPTGPNNLTYSFPGKSISGDATWSLSIPGNIANGEYIWASTGLAVGSKDATEVSVSSWSTVYSIAHRVDGLSIEGQEGRSPTYRGAYDPSEEYIAIDPDRDTNTPGRGDIVKYTNGLYYICIKTTTAGTDPTNTTHWKTFGNQFESVATDILLAQEAFITNGLVMGKPTEAGYIISNGFRPGVDYNPLGLTDDKYTTAGFLLGRNDDNDNNNVYFDVGGPLYGKTSLGVNSYLRFSSSTGKVEISSASFNGSINIGTTHTPLDFQAYADDDAFASFVGGGYNNNINTDSVGCGIIAGAENTMTAAFSMIGAGYANECNDNFSFIGGGYANKFQSTTDQNGANFIGAGEKNTINGGSNQAIIGGDFNTIEYDPPERYFYGIKGKFVVSDSSYIIGGFALGAGEEWRADKIYNTDDLVYVSIDNPENLLSLDDYFRNAGTTPYYKQNVVWRRRSSSSGQLVEGPREIDSTYWKRSYNNPYIGNGNWITNSWLASELLFTGNDFNQVALDNLLDGRYPIRRNLGWFYAVNIGRPVDPAGNSLSGPNGWGYMYVNTKDNQHSELWIFFSSLTAYPSDVSNAWCWFGRDQLLDDGNRYFYQDGYGWKRLVN